MNYFGQGALLLERPDAIDNPFYKMAPSWALYPMVVMATLASIIASQALISGAFSVARQASMLGFLPRFRVLHTSDYHIGQIYSPTVNWLLMVAAVGAVWSFGSSVSLLLGDPLLLGPEQTLEEGAQLPRHAICAPSTTPHPSRWPMRG